MSAQQQAQTNAPRSTSMPAELEALAEKADQARDVLRLATVPPLLSLVRGLFNECGIARRTSDLDAAIRALHDGPDLVANAREALLGAQERERLARERYEAAVIEAEWKLDGKFVSEGNRTYLVVWHTADSCDKPTADAKGWEFITDAADGEGAWQERRQMTADERRQWVRRTAAESRDVLPLASDLRGAEHAVAMCRVDVERAEDRWGAARYALDASRTQLAAAATQLDCLAHAARGHDTNTTSETRATP